jgi:hypothetical protein
LLHFPMHSPVEDSLSSPCKDNASPYKHYFAALAPAKGI